MSDQPGFTSSSAGSRPLALSSATITAESTRSGDPDLLLPLELSITVRILENFEIELATTERPGAAAANSPAETPAAERRELHVNPILLSLLPDVIHLTGRSQRPRHEDATARAYTLRLTFSGGSAAAQLWSTTFEVPRSPVTTSPWHLTVPFRTHEISGETT